MQVADSTSARPEHGMSCEYGSLVLTEPMGDTTDAGPMVSRDGPM